MTGLRRRLSDWHLHLGATADEMARGVPGDELMEEAGPDAMRVRILEPRRALVSASGDGRS